jgi:hypothetical protein
MARARGVDCKDDASTGFFPRSLPKREAISWTKDDHHVDRKALEPCLSGNGCCPFSSTSGDVKCGDPAMVLEGFLLLAIGRAAKGDDV